MGRHKDKPEPIEELDEAQLAVLHAVGARWTATGEVLRKLDGEFGAARVLAALWELKEDGRLCQLEQWRRPAEMRSRPAELWARTDITVVNLDAVGN